MPNALPAQRFRLFLWLAMLCSVVMYAGITRLVQPSEARPNPVLTNALLIGAAVFVVVSLFIRSWFDERAAQMKNPRVREVGFILGLVFCETGVLYGVVNWFMTGSQLSYAMMAIGFVGLLLHHPGRDSQA